MDEFVSKKLLVAKFNKLASKYIDGDKRQRGLAYTTAADMIALAPATDVQPIRHGWWELTNNPRFRKCSECGAWWSSDITNNYFTNYCPKCGARMMKEGDINE